MGWRFLVFPELRETMCIAGAKERFNEWWNKAQIHANEQARIGYSAIVFAVASFAVYLGVKAGLAIAFAVISVAVGAFFPTRLLK